METMVKNYHIYISNYFTPYKYEKWLESLAADGWILQTIEGNYKHTFIKGKPKKIRFFMDNVKTSIKDSTYYKQIYKDDNWNLIYSSPPFYLWSKEYDEVRPEPTTEIERVKGLIKNLMLTLGYILFIDLSHFIIRIPLGRQLDILNYYLLFTIIFGAYPFFYLIKYLKKLRKLQLK